MKKNKYICLIVLVSLVFGSTSCDDWFDLKPESETVFEDYWKNESDVLSVIGSCYRGMNETGFMERLIVWGEARSDNTLKGSGNEGELTKMLDLVFDASNGYTTWGDFYKVINYCNTVIYYAPDVRNLDPNFSEGQLRAYIAEAKGIRALCYFTLVRTFRDIPFITEPTVDDSRSFNVAQSSPGDVIDFLIEDLKGVENSAISGYENLQYDKGRITQKAIRALIADMYLWRNDYDNCIAYCDKVLDDLQTRLTLEQSTFYSQSVFFFGNSDESIFELQFGSSIQNYCTYEMYCKTPPGGSIRDGHNSFLLSSFDFSKASPALFGQSDLRGKDAYYPVESSGYFPIMKYVAVRNINTSGTVRENDYGYISNSPNWIFYRLSDIYLMKAEALVEKGSQTNLEDAFKLVGLTYDRANPELGLNSLNFDDYSTQALMRNLVFDERQREFLFEGKRYFDLLRRINREGSPVNVVNTYLMRKYSALDQATVKSKLSDIDALYMPINRDELKLNTLLVQNPFYNTASDINKQ